MQTYIPLLDKHHFKSHVYQLKLLKFDINAINSYVNKNQECLKCLECKLLLHNLLIHLLLNNKLIMETSESDIDNLITHIVPIIGSEYSKIVDILINTYQLVKVNKLGFSYNMFVRNTEYLGKSMYSALFYKNFDVNNYDISKRVVDTICKFLKFCDKEALQNMTVEQADNVNKLIDLIDTYNRTSNNFQLAHQQKLQNMVDKQNLLRDDQLKVQTLNENKKTQIFSRITTI